MGSSQSYHKEFSSGLRLYSLTGLFRTEADIDLLLLHWPHESVPLAEQIGLLNETVREAKSVMSGSATSIGNYLTKRSVSPLFRSSPINSNIILTSTRSLLIDATRKAGLAVTAYCAMAIGRVHRPEDNEDRGKSSRNWFFGGSFKDRQENLLDVGTKAHAIDRSFDEPSAHRSDH